MVLNVWFRLATRWPFYTGKYMTPSYVIKLFPPSAEVRVGHWVQYKSKTTELNYLILVFGLLTSIGLRGTSAVFQFFSPIYFALVFFQFLIFEGWNTTWPGGATAKRKEISPRHVKKIDRIGHSAEGTRKILTVDETRRCWGVKSLGHAGGRRDDVDIGLPIQHQIDGLTSGFIPLVMY